VSKALEFRGMRSNTARIAKAKCGLAGCMAPPELRRQTEHTSDQMRRRVLGKSSQTFMPQKWEPSVQMGVVMPARRWHGGPM
jgi:hypothetical protein